MELGVPPPFSGEMGDHEDDHSYHANSIDDEEDNSNSSFPSDLPSDHPATNRDVSVTPPQKPPDNDDRITDESVEASNENVEDDDEWGEFGDAPRTQPPGDQLPEPSDVHTSIHPPSDKNEVSNDDDDDWGDFDQARVVESPSRRESVVNDQSVIPPAESDVGTEGDDWGDFGGAETKASANDDWAAEFVSAPERVEESPEFQSLEEMFADDTLWTEEWEDDPEVSDEQQFNFFNLFDKSDKDMEDDPSKEFAKVWMAMRVIEDAKALELEWKSSEACKRQYNALNIKPIAPKPTMPSLSTSSVLTPSSVSADKPGRRVLVSKDGSSATLTASNEQSASGQPSSSQTESLSMPIAEFDWETSGLVNPLKGASRSSAIMDVDFLTANSGATIGSEVTLQRDLEELGIGGSTSKNTDHNQRSVMDSLMSSSSLRKSSSHRQPSELSLDARALYDLLPDIDFLNASMIMFPLKGLDNNSQP